MMGKPIMRIASTLIALLVIVDPTPSLSQGVIETESQESHTSQPLSLPPTIKLPPPRYEENCPSVDNAMLLGIVKKFNAILRKDEKEALQRQVDQRATWRCRDLAVSLLFLRFLSGPNFEIRRR